MVIERKILPGLGTAFFTLACLWMLIESMSRQLFAHSFAISEEVILFSLTWALFLTLAQSGREGFHIDTDLVVRKLPAGAKRVIKRVTLLLSVFYTVLIAFSAIKFIPFLRSGKVISSSPLQLPMWIVYLAIPVGGILLALYYIETFVKTFRKVDQI